MKQFYALSLVLGLLFGRSEFASAQTSPLPDVYISEVAWSGSSLSIADEWLEITNRSRETVDLGGWIVDGAATSGGAIQIAPDTLLESGSALVIANYESGNPKSTLTIAPQLVTTTVSLANSGLTLRLIDPQGTVIDTLAFGSSPSAGGSSPFRSAVRLDTGELVSATLSTNLSDSSQLGTPGIVDIPWLESASPDTSVVAQITEPELITESPAVESPTAIEPDPILVAEPDIVIEPAPITTVEPEPILEPILEPVSEPEIIPLIEVAEPEVVLEQYITESPAITVIDLSNQNTVRLSEFIPDPLDGIEWVELENPSTESVILDGMYLTDASGSRTMLSGTLDAKSFLTIHSPKGKLNNSGDMINLFTAGNDLIDSVTYGTDLLDNPNKGESIGRIENEWTILETTTPSEANQANPEIDQPAEVQNVNSPEATLETVETPSTEPDTFEEPALQEILPKSEIQAPPRTVKIVSVAEKPNPSKTKKATSSKKKASGMITLVGTITAAPGEFGKQIAYIEGTQLYMNSAQWPSLTSGDVVQATGISTISNGEPRLKLKDASAITITDHATVSIQAFRSSMLSAEYTGYEVHIDGLIVERTKKAVQIEIDGSRATLMLPKDVNGLLLAQDSLAGNVIIRGAKEGFYLEAPSKDALEITMPEQAPTQSQAHTTHSSSKSMAGAGLATGTLGALGYWLRKYLMIS